MTGLRHRLLHRLCTRLYYERVTVRGAEHLPRSGPALYLPLHRNGAIDGFVLSPLLPRATFLVAAQLLRSRWLRVFFAGLAVVRGKDVGDRSHNASAVRAAVELLQRGGELIVFPEGTSSLAPGHLPFQPGAARIAARTLAAGAPLQIVPIALCYERAWAFRSRVEVVVGPPVATDLDENASAAARVATLQARITEALERAADVATASGGRRRAVGPSAVVFAVARSALLGALALPGLLLNLPPLAAAFVAARVAADGKNVVALWRVLVGVPVFAAWTLAVAALLVFTAGVGWAAAHLVLTAVALHTVGPAMRPLRSAVA